MDIKETYEYMLAHTLWLDGIQSTKNIRYQGIYNITSIMWDNVENILQANHETWKEEIYAKQRSSRSITRKNI